ncbi:aminopeptidase-like domain-containing protein [Mariniphaga anaerophila]|uniref:Aminopeptidase-like domain-containing protein n=1 Tax=Mariniphaga anaerophila TaxID=1484053 RepID=A0A1M5BKV6_9BACT|nr:DUF4910 domain-containing protein [Mariniphaga anaerophila]SHF43108.1 aminopeptidase-like domain-containing protein [Mariniphaga anaerophila]
MLENNTRDINFRQSGESMYKLAERLFPICRSITGNGVRETLSILQETVPLDVTEIPSGTHVLDWEIPNEWNIRDAWIKTPGGEKIANFRKSNLHVLNYSMPVNQEVDLATLKEHLYSIPEHPEWIPYRTSYYNQQWGFCMPHNQLEKLEEGNYQVKIDSEIKPGALTYGEFIIPGETEEEVLFSCHICHPSLCNDNLSGIVIATELAKFLKNLDLRYSYRFLFIPGTIGSIAWLSKNEEKASRIKHGLVLTLLGDASPFHYKKTRSENTEIDEIMAYLLKDEDEAKLLDFSPYGYDERQFCSPGFNLPVGRISRKPFGEFPEYHTSADNLDFISAEKLGESLQLLVRAVSVIEGNRKWINRKPKGEPQLGKRGLYQAIGGATNQEDFRMALLWVLNFSDGEHSLLDIAKKSKIDFSILKFATDKLVSSGLLTSK